MFRQVTFKNRQTTFLLGSVAYIPYDVISHEQQKLFFQTFC